MSKKQQTNFVPQPVTIPSHLPLGVYEFWAAFPTGSLPSCPDEVWQVVNTAVRKGTATAQRNALNNGMKGLRQRKNQPLKDFCEWLNTPDVLRLTRQAGVFWAHLKWWRAIGAILQEPQLHGGAKNKRYTRAHEAFSGVQPGRRSPLHFTGPERAAAYIISLRNNKSPSIECMIADWAKNLTQAQADKVNEREVRRIISDDSHALWTLPGAELYALALGKAWPMPFGPWSPVLTGD